MPGVARKDGRDKVKTNHSCDTETVTDTGSGNVFANNIGVVRKGDVTKVHKWPRGSLCVNHQPPLNSYSPNVFANNLQIGRLGDYYGDNEKLITASNNVFANGGNGGGGGSVAGGDDTATTVKANGPMPKGPGSDRRSDDQEAYFKKYGHYPEFNGDYNMDGIPDDDNKNGIPDYEEQDENKNNIPDYLEEEWAHPKPKPLDLSADNGMGVLLSTWANNVVPDEEIVIPDDSVVRGISTNGTIRFKILNLTVSELSMHLRLQDINNKFEYHRERNLSSDFNADFRYLDRLALQATIPFDPNNIDATLGYFTVELFSSDVSSENKNVAFSIKTGGYFAESLPETVFDYLNNADTAVFDPDSDIATTGTGVPLSAWSNNIFKEDTIDIPDSATKSIFRGIST